MVEHLAAQRVRDIRSWSHCARDAAVAPPYVRPAYPVGHPSAGPLRGESAMATDHHNAQDYLVNGPTNAGFKTGGNGTGIANGVVAEGNVFGVYGIGLGTVGLQRRDCGRLRRVYPRNRRQGPVGARLWSSGGNPQQSVRRRVWGGRFSGRRRERRDGCSRARRYDGHSRRRR
jgi:hypothetical protein